MKCLMRIFWWCLVVVVTLTDGFINGTTDNIMAFAQSTQSKPLKPTVLIQKIDAVVAAEIKNQQAPGLAIAIIHKGEVVVAKGYGMANVELQVPVTTETLFQSGSVGKQFTAAAVMLLVEDGKLSLDDPITKIFPDAPWRWHSITIRHLLTHTSGIPDYEYDITGIADYVADNLIDLRKDYTEDQLVKLAFGLKLEFEPGTRFNYSNTGYVLLGCIIHKVSGQFYGDLLRDRVFRPIGMQSTRIISEEDIIPHRAAGYRLVKGELKNQEWVSPSLNTTADGSLYFSIHDMIAWDKAIRDKSLLKQESWAKVYTPVTLTSGKTYPYGFGWCIDEDRGQLQYHHGGAWVGFRTYISRYIEDDLTVIVLVNLADATPEDFVFEIASLFNPLLAPPDKPIPDKDLAVTARLNTLLAKAREGKLTPDECTYIRAGFFPNVAVAYQKLLDPLGQPERLYPIEYLERGDDRVFRYRAEYKKQTIEILFALAPDNKVSLFQLREIKRSVK